MIRSIALLSPIACGLVAAVAAGCGGAYDNPMQNEPATPSSGAANSSAAAKPADQTTQPEPAAAQPAAATPGETLIQLSAGTALPQSLPTGTAMGFSVDYRFVDGQPDPAAQYFWVIEPAKGKPVKQPVQLKSQGTLEGFVAELRPDNGPFQTHVEDQGGTRLSKSCPLR